MQMNGTTYATGFEAGTSVKRFHLPISIFRTTPLDFPEVTRQINEEIVFRRRRQVNAVV